MQGVMRGDLKEQIDGVRAVFKRTRGGYAGADLGLAQRFALLMWPAGTALVTLLMPFFPPTRVIGAWGWLLPVVSTSTVAAGLIVLRRAPERVNWNALYVSGYFGLLSLGVTQWFAGGRIAPYHELFLLQIIANGLMHPPRRFALFVLATAGVAFAPAFYAPDSALPGEITTELALWTGIGVFMLALMGRIRAQRAELKQAGDEAHQLARVDALTGLGNRRAFDEALERELTAAIANGGHVSLLVADLNGFKQINDRHGHLAGDHCLRQAADALRAALRDGDDCFRWGGDEFAVLLGHARAGDAAALAQRLEDAVAGSCRGPDGQPLSLACGHAEIAAGATPAQAVAAADAVLLDLKQRGAPAPRALHRV
jgi:diguanylate cyclase (GGDEF)-like protein